MSDTTTATHTWEDAVRWLREQPEYAQLVLDCYYDDPLEEAADRFWRSEEWRATRDLTGPPRGWAVDLGAGRGIASYALARDGWPVAALEPDASDLVGSGAIALLAKRTSLPIAAVRQFGEALPFRTGSIALVYARAALHHAGDLDQVAREVARVLRPGGTLVAVREHVVSNDAQLAAFLNMHPLHRLYGGENAHRLDTYIAALERAGLRVRRVLGPLESMVNAAPLATDQWLATVRAPLARRFGDAVARLLLDERHPLGRALMALWVRLLSRMVQVPGRLFSFVAVRP